MEFHEAFKTVFSRRCLVQKALSEVSGCHTSQIKKVLDGQGTVTITTMQSLLDGMEKLSPGAKYEFFSLWGIDSRSDLDRAISAICRAPSLNQNQRTTLTRALVKHHQLAV